ncbi:MAG: SMI1/KNR4 family protein [Planctomycetes bacterium]|nr:SMI1/KNR4 family protein [Planctomycetota bacterium]
MPQHYHDVEFTKSFRRVTVTAIRKIETLLGVVLPDDYREFLRAVNGGIPTPGEFEMAKPSRPSERVCIDFFYGIGATRRQNDLLREQREVIERTDSLPKGFVTIGLDPGGAPYFISTTGKKSGAIYFYDPDGFLDPGGSPQSYLVARSFTDLLARLAVGS